MKLDQVKHLGCFARRTTLQDKGLAKGNVFQALLEVVDLNVGLDMGDTGVNQA